MAFTTLSGAYSHYREGNIQLKSGLIVGALACIASFAGAKVAPFIPEESLHYLTAGMLFIRCFMMIKLFVLNEEAEQQPLSSRQLMTRGIILGLVSGMLSGMFGIGSAPFIQVGLLILLKLSIRQAVGTTMLVIIPISIGGGIGYISEGYVDFILLIQILIGTVLGAFIGAKFTRLAPKLLLKSAVLLTPIIAGLLLLF